MKATLLFFRTQPPNLEKRPPLASSLQSFESALISIRFGRFPDALVQLVTAWESCIKAALRIPETTEMGLDCLLQEIQKDKPSLHIFSPKKLAACRKARNRIIHYGFSPEDDEESARLILETGVPFYEELLQRYFGHWLTWQSASGTARQIDELPEILLGKVLLLPQIGDNLHLAREYYRKVIKVFRSVESRNAYILLAHELKRSHDPSCSISEGAAIGNSQVSGALFESQCKVAQWWDDHFGYGNCQWFDCPICGEPGGFVASFAKGAVSRGEFRFHMGHCVACDLHVPDSAVQLIELILEDQLTGSPMPGDHSECLSG